MGLIMISTEMFQYQLKHAFPKQFKEPLFKTSKNSLTI